jgi:hypothetical protein
MFRRRSNVWLAGTSAVTVLRITARLGWPRPRRSQITGDHMDIVSVYLYAQGHSEDIHLWPRLLDRGERQVARIVHLMERQQQAIERLNTELPPGGRSALVRGA